MRKKLKFLLPVFITLLILSIIYFVGDLYPFGAHSINQVDADYQYIPVLFRIYDFLHGTEGILYDDIGLGNNIYISMIIQGSIFSPVNLLLYFTTRSNIINFFNVLVLAKICLLSLTTYIFINYKYKVNEFYKNLFSVLFALSGWIMLNFFNIMWLDSVILFPLIVMYLDKLIYKEKYIGYVITLSLSLIISYYISYFILYFVLLYSFLNIFLLIDKKKRKKIIFRLGISTLTSILISGFSLFPALYQTLFSGRLDKTGSASSLLDCFINKSIYLMGSALFILLFVFLISNFKSDKKKIYIHLILLLLLIVGLFIEPINLAIHLGSHWSFPYRYSFLTIFVLMMGSLTYLEKYEFKGILSHWLFFTYLLLFILGIFLANKYHSQIVEKLIVLDFDDEKEWIYIITIFVVNLAMYILSVLFRNTKIKYITLSMSSLFIVFVYSSWTMKYTSGYYLTKESIEINDNIDLPKDGRYKMDYLYYTPDYGFIYNVDTLDNWLHILPSDELPFYKKMGYGTTDTCIRSYGGTIFSDWLFGFKYGITEKPVDGELYTIIDSYKEHYFYKYNYKSGFGLVYDKNDNIEKIDFHASDNPFQLQNNIHNAIFGYDIIDIDSHKINNTNTYSFKYNAKEKGFLYFYIDEKKKIIDSIKLNNNYIYNVTNYIRYLGEYEGEVNIKISFNQPVTEDFYFGFIPNSEVLKFVNDNQINDNYMEVYAEKDNSLFLPVNNIDGLKVIVNDIEREKDDYLGNFVSVKLDEGLNKVKLEYEMPLFKLGILFSVIGIILLILFKNISGNKIIYDVTYYLYIILIISMYIYFYSYSLFKYLR